MTTRAITIVALLGLAGCPSSGGRPDPQPPDPDPNCCAIDHQPTPVSAGETVRDGSELILPGPLVFVDNDTELDLYESEPVLISLRDFLVAHEDHTLIRIEGHGSFSTERVDEFDFTGWRAMSVAMWLSEHGIACERLLAAAFGGSKPIAEEGSALNTRMTIVVAQLRGVAIGGMPEDGGAAYAVSVCP